MRRNNLLFYLLVVGSVVLLNSGCQNASTTEGEFQAAPTKAEEQIMVKLDPNQPAPNIKFDQVVLDFGKIGPGSKSMDQFKFTNIGEDVLKISKVGQCCGVVTVLEKKEYNPGESGVLKATLNAPVRIGSQMRQLVISSNDPVNPSVRLTIKFEVEPKIACEPKRLKLLLNEDNAGCPKLVLTSLDDQPFAITGFRSTANCITAEYDPTVEATEFVLTPKVDMELIQKNQKGSIDINLTHPESNITSIQFDVVPKFVVNPPLLIVFNAVPQEPIRRKVWILNNYEEDFEIVSAKSKNNTIKVISQNKVNNGYQFEVEITPPDQEDQLRFTDVFNIEINGDQTKALVCNGYYARTKPLPPKK